MANKALWIVALIWSATILSCEKKEEGKCVAPPVTVAAIQGSWAHDYGVLTESEEGFVLPPKFSFTFSGDSFFMMINQYSDIIADTGGCQYLDWKEYAKGTFTLQDGTIHLQGVYADSNYEVKNGGCYNSGPFSDSFKAEFCRDDLLLNWLNPKASQVEKREIKLIRD